MLIAGEAAVTIRGASAKASDSAAKMRRGSELSSKT